MPVPKTHCVISIGEMADDVILKTDVLEKAIVGRDAVVAVIEKLEALYTSHVVLYESHIDSRDIRICSALTVAGDKVELISVALRDDAGWVTEVHLGHDPASAVRKLASAFGF